MFGVDIESNKAPVNTWRSILRRMLRMLSTSALELPWRSTGQPWNCRSLFSQILWQESLQFPSRAGNFEGLVREGEQYHFSFRGLTVGMRIGFEVGIRIGIGISMPADFGAKDGYV